MKRLPFALQLYTVRDHMEKDAGATLKRVKQIGYDFVELAGLGGHSAESCKRLLEEAGLTAISNHFGLSAVSADVASVIATCRTLELKHAVVPHASADSKEGWIGIAKALDKAGERLREAGIRLGYHNHAHEFTAYEGRYAFDLLFETARPENLAAQIDTFWVKYGGADPVAVIKKYAGRCPLLHVKDMAPQGAKPIFAELGAGVMNWPPIFEAAQAAGTEWYIVEQDECRGDSLESARVSAAFMARQ